MNIMICRKLGKYTGLEIQRPAFNFDDGLYKIKIDEILEYKVKLRKKETPVKEGDEVIIGICGYNEKNEIIPFSQEDKYQVIIGKELILKEFEQALIGKKPGENVTVNLVFPPDHHVHAGKPVRFEISLQSAYDRILPELTDDFVAELDIDGVYTLEHLEQFTRAHVIDIQKSAMDENLRNDLMMRIIDASDYEIDEEEIQKQVKDLSEEFARIISAEGITLQDYLNKACLSLEEHLNKLRKRALYTLKYRCIVEKIATDENISVSDDEIMTEASSGAEHNDLAAKEFALLKRLGPEKLKSFVLSKKVMEFVFDNAKVLKTTRAFNKTTNFGTSSNAITFSANNTTLTKKQKWMFI
jgi:trigger factor